VGGLREAGFDLFAFDFRNHGDSQSEPGFNPLHWVTDRELTDLRAALDYLRSRPDADPAGVALFGVSRGGGAALCVAAADPTVWAVATDGAFPTRSTMMHYVYKWAHVLVRHWWLKLVPKWLYRFAGSTARVQASRRRSVAFPRLERAVPKIPPRPWLAIHGSDDSYVPTEVVEALVRRAGRSASTQLWLVPEAKHNRCREVAPDEYRRRVVGFFVSAAPRLAQPTEPATEVSDGSPHVVRASKSLVVPQGKR
jgi:pimeloyl-ACP methyl ester carboxylesterase